MAVYAVGDVQGCFGHLQKLLDTLHFDPAKDTLWLVGDLVNRGAESLQTLRFVKQLGERAVCVLGNHDLHLLAVAEGIKPAKGRDTLQPILRAAERDELLHWLRFRPLVHCDADLKMLMVHAGVYPGWRRRDLLAYANEVETLLRGPQYRQFLQQMYGRQPRVWRDELCGWARVRFITNALTRMRYCDPRRRLDFTHKDAPGSQPPGLLPWFEHPKLKCKGWRIVSGHWSALGFVDTPRLIALDTGCVWGGKLTARQLDRETPPHYWQLACDT